MSDELKRIIEERRKNVALRMRQIADNLCKEMEKVFVLDVVL